MAPGDFAVALAAFDASVHTTSRTLAFDDFYLLPGETPHVEHPLAPGELIVGISVPGTEVARKSVYLKVRDRQSYEFAAASAAAGIAFEDDGWTIAEVRLALGGVATRPWRARGVEAALKGKTLSEETATRATANLMEEAVAAHGNAYKIVLAPRVAVRALLMAGGVA